MNEQLRNEIILLILKDVLEWWELDVEEDEREEDAKNFAETIYAYVKAIEEKFRQPNPEKSHLDWLP